MDRSYWDEYYSRPLPDIADPSDFARWARGFLSDGAHVFELGCGNGRDARFFYEQGLRVSACDQSEVAITQLKRTRLAQTASLLVSTFANLPQLSVNPDVDAVYSRFTLHAVPKQEASMTLSWCQDVLRPEGQLFIEVRSVKDALYGRGEQTAPDTFRHGAHQRRFVRLDELMDELAMLRFVVDEAIEQTGLAVHKQEDPVVIRIRARKQS